MKVGRGMRETTVDEWGTKESGDKRWKGGDNAGELMGRKANVPFPCHLLLVKSEFLKYVKMLLHYSIQVEPEL